MENKEVYRVAVINPRISRVLYFYFNDLEKAKECKNAIILTSDYLTRVDASIVKERVYDSANDVIETLKDYGILKC